jgi:hypothetical protein
MKSFKALYRPFRRMFYNVRKANHVPRLRHHIPPTDICILHSEPLAQSISYLYLIRNKIQIITSWVKPFRNLYFSYFVTLNDNDAFTVARRSKACTVFARFEAGIVGSDLTEGMGVHCLCVCASRDFATSWSPAQGVLPNVYYLVNRGETESFMEIGQGISWDYGAKRNKENDKAKHGRRHSYAYVKV